MAKKPQLAPHREEPLLETLTQRRMRQEEDRIEAAHGSGQAPRPPERLSRNSPSRPNSLQPTHFFTAIEKLSAETDRLRGDLQKLLSHFNSAEKAHEFPLPEIKSWQQAFDVIRVASRDIEFCEKQLGAIRAAVIAIRDGNPALRADWAKYELKKPDRPANRQ